MNDENALVKEGMKQLFDKASAFLEKVTTPPLKELGSLLADQVKLWRFKNQINIINKAQDFLQKKGVSPKQVPIKTLAPLLEYCSLEEDEDMQTKWASLLANAANPEFKDDIYSSYIEILKQLSPLEAKILDFLFNKGKRAFLEEIYDKCKSIEADLKRENLDRLIEDLMRLNLITYPKPYL